MVPMIWVPFRDSVRRRGGCLGPARGVCESLELARNRCAFCVELERCRGEDVEALFPRDIGVTDDCFPEPVSGPAMPGHACVDFRPIRRDRGRVVEHRAAIGLAVTVAACSGEMRLLANRVLDGGGARASASARSRTRTVACWIAHAP
jgi:hypothetical protein